MAATAASLAGGNCSISGSLPPSWKISEKAPVITAFYPLKACRTSAVAECPSLEQVSRKKRTCPVVARALPGSTAQRRFHIGTRLRDAGSHGFEHTETTFEWEESSFHRQEGVPLPFSGLEGKEVDYDSENPTLHQTAKLGRLQKFLGPEPEEIEFASMPFTSSIMLRKGHRGQEVEEEEDARRCHWKNQVWPRGQRKDHKRVLDLRVHKASAKSEVTEQRGQHRSSSFTIRQVSERDALTSSRPRLRLEGFDPSLDEGTEVDVAHVLSKSKIAKNDRSVEAYDSKGVRPGHKVAPSGYEEAAAQKSQGSFKAGTQAGAREAFKPEKTDHFMNRQSIGPIGLESRERPDSVCTAALDPLLTILEDLPDLSSGTSQEQRKFEARYSLRRKQQKALSAALEDEVLLHQPWEVEQPKFPAEPPIGLELFYKKRTEPLGSRTSHFRGKKEKRGGPWQVSKRRQYYRQKRLEQLGLIEGNEVEKQQLNSNLHEKAESADSFLFPPLPRPVPHETIRRRKLHPEPSQKFIGVPPKQRQVLSLREAVSWSRDVRNR